MIIFWLNDINFKIPIPKRTISSRYSLWKIWTKVGDSLQRGLRDLKNSLNSLHGLALSVSVEWKESLALLSGKVT